MSDFKFACPQCGQRLRCDDRHAGRQILCPKCQHLILIPAPSTASFARALGILAGDSRATLAPHLTISPSPPADSLKDKP
jgi:DNA-directed RNA polymerase subunit RPC12/RpoP